MKRKIIVSISILFIVIGFLTYNYIYKEHRNIAEEEVVLLDEALNFYSNYLKNADEFSANYLDKVVEIKGEITEMDANSLVFDNKVYVLFTDSLYSNITINNNIIIKGRFVGYDDLLEVLKIDQATVVNK